ncbi:MAG: DegV family protein [Bacilli bacterium]|nr:DegV family protein [Bacillales bacterium]MDY2575633.1 DegV family protein [Bacilli bacterium]
MKVKILVDSTCDLPESYLKDNDVEIIPLIVTFNEEQFYDLEEINTKTLYEKIERTRVIPKTAARSIDDFSNKYKSILSQGYDQIVYLGISSYFSSSVQNATIASKEFEGKVFVHDTLNLSSGEGLQVLKAIKWVKEGLTGEEILERLKELAPRVRSQFAVESLDFLHRGGRCSQTSYYLGSALRIKPIIKVVDGKMIVYRKPIGKMTNALNKMLEIIKEDVDKLDLDTVMITHSFAFESEKYLYEELSKFIPKEKIMVTDAGCVISSHCGKGTIGILYIVNK